MYCNLTDGKKIGMPRYYKLKIYKDEEQRKLIGEETWHRMAKKNLSKQKLNITQHTKQINTAKHLMAIRSQSTD